MCPLTMIRLFGKIMQTFFNFSVLKTQKCWAKLSFLFLCVQCSPTRGLRCRDIDQCVSYGWHGLCKFCTTTSGETNHQSKLLQRAELFWDLLKNIAQCRLAFKIHWKCWGKIVPLSFIDSAVSVHCLCERITVCFRGNVTLYTVVCVCMPLALICRFVPIISEVIGPNTAIHTSFSATEANTLKRRRCRKERKKKMHS